MIHYLVSSHAMIMSHRHWFLVIVSHHLSHQGHGGYQRVMSYIERCLPNTTNRSLDSSLCSSAEEGDSDWNTVQASITATLLPTLKFHDLVFGHVLGEGAFSVVKYARLITKVNGLIGMSCFYTDAISSSSVMYWYWCLCFCLPVCLSTYIE